jgi:hypothetical protein
MADLQRNITRSPAPRMANMDLIPFHRYRMQVIAQWPETEYKKASLGAARAAVKSVETTTVPLAANNANHASSSYFA